MAARRRTSNGWPGRDPGHSLTIAGRRAPRYRRVSDNPELEQASLDQQASAYDEWAEREAVLPDEDYADDDRPASKFATRPREDFEQLRADITAGRHDGKVLWFWASSRQTRGDVPLDTLAAESEAHHIIWVMDGQKINPANDDDMMIAGLNNLMNKAFSARLSKDVLRGKKGAALAGRPSAVPLYGYRRVYRTGEDGVPVLAKGRPVVDRDEPDERPPDGHPVTDSPAQVVQEIYDRIEANDTLVAIARSLETRRIPAARHPRKCTTCGVKLGKAKACPYGHVQDLCRWRASSIRFIATNVGYLGKRIFQAESASIEDRDAAVLDGVTAKWPPLIKAGQFYRVRAILADASRIRWTSPDRGAHKPRTREYVLVPAARCGECGEPLGGHDEPNGTWYKCRKYGCVSVRADWLERWAENRLVSWLVLPDVRSQIWGSREADNARRSEKMDELAELDEELRQLRKLNAARRISLVAFSDREQAILADMTAANAVLKAGPAGIPHDIFGPDAADKWVALKQDDSRAAARFLAGVTIIYVNQAATRGGGRTRGPDEDRYEWHWKIGEEVTVPRSREGATERVRQRKAALDEARRKAEELLLGDPSLADAVVGRMAGCAYGTAGRIRRQLTEAGKITDPGYRTGRDGKRYVVVPDAAKVTGAKVLWLPEARTCATCGEPFEGTGEYCGRPACYPSLSKAAMAGKRERIQAGLKAAGA